MRISSLTTRVVCMKFESLFDGEIVWDTFCYCILFAMSAMPIFKGERGHCCWKHKQTNLFASFRLWHRHMVVSGAGKSRIYTFYVHMKWGRTDGHRTMWLRHRRYIFIWMRHAITFIYLIFDQFILIKSSFIPMSSRPILLVHLPFCINKILF